MFKLFRLLHVYLTFYICQCSTLPSSYLHQKEERGCQGNFKVTDSLPPVINLVYHITTMQLIILFLFI